MASNKDLAILNPEIVSICQSIGHFDKASQTYIKDDQCSLSLRDLLREIKREQEPFIGRRQLAAANVVGTDLIPLIRDYCLEDEELLRIILHLLVILTRSAIYSMGETVPEDKNRKRLFLELQQDNSKYKLLFSSSFKVWAVLGTHLTRLLGMDWESRSTNDDMLIEAIFILVTNLLHVSSESYATVEDNPHDRLIHLLDQSGITELVLIAASDTSGRFYMYTLEIFSLLLRDQDARTLAQIDQVQAKEKKSIDPDLDRIAARDKRPLKYRRFKDSTYQIKNFKSLSDRDMIYHKELNVDGSISLGEKQMVRKARKRQNMKESDFGAQIYDELSLHRSPPKILRHLSKMCLEFLEQYNDLMPEARSHVTRSSNQGDNTILLWALAFFMEFNRYSKKNVALVSCTYSTETLHFVHTLLLTALDQLRAEKKCHSIPSRRLHAALRAYKEIICTLAFADASDDIEFDEVTKKIKWTAFYEEEYRDLLPQLLKEYNPVKMSRRYLIDLVCITHVFLRLFKSYCTINSSVIVKEKARKPRKSKKASKEKWRMMIDELRDGLAGKNTLPTVEEEPEVIPIDATADFEADSQKTSIVVRIKKLLQDSRPLSAIALYRNARSAYIEDPEQPFGSEISSLEEEENALKAIFDEVSLEDEDEEDTGPVTRERELNFTDFFKKFCVPKAIIPHIILLKDFDKNSTKTNHAVVKFLYRVAFDYDLHGMLFQACIFRIFQKIFKQPVTDEWSKELNQFSKHVVRKFIEIYPKNNKILIELLFWKTTRDARALEEGYGATDSFRNADSDDEIVVRDTESPDEDASQQVDPDKLGVDDHDIDMVNDPAFWEDETSDEHGASDNDASKQTSQPKKLSKSKKTPKLSKSSRAGKSSQSTKSSQSKVSDQQKNRKNAAIVPVSKEFVSDSSGSDSDDEPAATATRLELDDNAIVPVSKEVVSDSSSSDSDDEGQQIARKPSNDDAVSSQSRKLVSSSSDSDSDEESPVTTSQPKSQGDSSQPSKKLVSSSSDSDSDDELLKSAAELKNDDTLETQARKLLLESSDDEKDEESASASTRRSRILQVPESSESESDGEEKSPTADVVATKSAVAE